MFVVCTTFTIMGHGVNTWYSDSILVEITLLINPYKVIQNDSNGHGCYFKKCYYSNI
jgi:hypothetical protein